MSNRTVLVTGAGDGIGRAVALRCLREGFRVLACDVDEVRLEALGSSCRSAQVSLHKIDIADESGVKSLFERLRSIGCEANFLVNNAGIYLGKSLLEYSSAEIQRVVAVNCLGALHMTRYFVEPLLARQASGVIVNISSVSGQEGSSDAVYGLTKGALLGLTKSCAMNFAPHIRVNAVAPALVNTRLIERVSRQRISEYRSGELLAEAIQPEDVADTVAFLLGEESRCYTGATFDINNGHYRR